MTVLQISGNRLSEDGRLGETGPAAGRGIAGASRLKCCKLAFLATGAAQSLPLYQPILPPVN